MTRIKEYKTMLLIFVLLQALDLLTTFSCFKAGGEELNPIISWGFMSISPGIGGVALAKVFAITLALIGVYFNRIRAIKVINCIYVGVVIWNTHVLATALH